MKVFDGFQTEANRKFLISQELQHHLQKSFEENRSEKLRFYGSTGQPKNQFFPRLLAFGEIGFLAVQMATGQFS